MPNRSLRIDARLAAPEDRTPQHVALDRDLRTAWNDDRHCKCTGSILGIEDPDLMESAHQRDLSRADRFTCPTRIVHDLSIVDEQP